jgi:uncharacterized repeat protein (TIGR03803 family)
MIRGSASALGFLALAVFASLDGASAAATYQTLYSFTGGSDGASPRSGLVMDAAGTLYGTTPKGGASNLGTLFKLAPDGTFTLLHAFSGGRDGAVPTAPPLTLDRHGAIWGLTEQGGPADGGTAYRFRNGKMTVLHSFGPGNDGYWPISGLLLQPDGSFVGTTEAGGGPASSGNGCCGTIFRLTPDGSETILHAFAGGDSDGAGPVGTPVRDLAGNLYGATPYGGSSRRGTVFKLAPDGSESVFHVFSNSAAFPYQGLVIDRHGTIFGTTTWVNGSTTGTLFKIDSEGETSSIHTFGGHDGYGTGLPRLIRDRAHNLYGTTSVGGGNKTGDCQQAGGCGTVFRIAPDGSETIMHAFGGTDGTFPDGGVISDGSGNLYGTTMFGGATGYGTIFKISTGTK